MLLIIPFLILNPFYSLLHLIFMTLLLVYTLKTSKKLHDFYLEFFTLIFMLKFSYMYIVFKLSDTILKYYTGYTYNYFYEFLKDKYFDKFYKELDKLNFLNQNNNIYNKFNQLDNTVFSYLKNLIRFSGKSEIIYVKNNTTTQKFINAFLNNHDEKCKNRETESDNDITKYLDNIVNSFPSLAHADDNVFKQNDKNQKELDNFIESKFNEIKEEPNPDYMNEAEKLMADLKKSCNLNTDNTTTNECEHEKSIDPKQLYQKVIKDINERSNIQTV